MVILDKNNILLDVEFNNKEELITAVVGKMAENGYVKQSYATAVLERESQYPTGLPTEDVITALPHANSNDDVIKTGIGVARLVSPVEFNCMGDDETVLEVSLVFVLASTAGEGSHLEDLQNLMSCFTREGLLLDLMKASEVDEFVKIVENMEEYPEL